MKIAFLSNGGEAAKEALKILELHHADIVFKNNGKRVVRFPEYDLGISFLYTYKVLPDQLDKPWINFHPAPLPEYGGRNVAYHAIMNNSKVFGGTMHYMNEEFDCGEIIDCQRFSIEDDDTAGELVQKSYRVLVSLLEKYALPISNGELPKSTEQSNTRYYKQEVLDDILCLTEKQKKKVRALTVSPRHYAKVIINNKLYNVIPQ